MKYLHNRIPPPLVALLFALAMWGLATQTASIELSTGWRWAAVAVLWLFGLFFCAAGVASFRRAKTTVNPLKPDAASSLVISGIYRYSRNPMYVGFVLLLLAWAAFLSSPWSLLPVALYARYIQTFQIAPEERALQKLFGEDYRAYCQVVRRWL